MGVCGWCVGLGCVCESHTVVWVGGVGVCIDGVGVCAIMVCIDGVGVCTSVVYTYVTSAWIYTV